MRYDDYEDGWYRERPARHEVRRAYLFGGPRGSDFMSYSGQKVGTFSTTELQHLFIAFIILTVAFTFIFTNGAFTAINYPDLFLLFLPMSLIAVGTAFLCHEMGHKFMAQKYGMWAEFRADYIWLILGLGMAALLGFIFVAPGAVMIAGHPTRTENGKISAAGPAINIFFAAVCVPIVFLSYYNLSGYFFFLALIVGAVNVILAGFNMLPIWLFDGKKIWYWNNGIYIVMWILIIALGIFHLGIYLGAINPF